MKHSMTNMLYEGLWKNNPALLQLLGLCPLLAVTQTVVNALVLAVVTCGVMVCSSALVAALRAWIPMHLRIPIFVVCIASLVSMIDLVLNAWFFELYQVLGLFIALITTNCIVLGRIVVFSSKEPIQWAMWDAWVMGLGLGGVLVVVAAVRELLGQGTLFAGLDLIFGPQAKEWTWHLIPFLEQHPFIYMALPSGAFLGLALLTALKHYVDHAFQCH